MPDKGKQKHKGMKTISITSLHVMLSWLNWHAVYPYYLSQFCKIKWENCQLYSCINVLGNNNPRPCRSFILKNLCQTVFQPPINSRNVPSHEKQINTKLQYVSQAIHFTMNNHTFLNWRSSYKQPQSSQHIALITVTLNMHKQCPDCVHDYGLWNRSSI